MTLRLDAAAPDFEQRFVSLLAMKRESSPDVDETVRAIIEDVVARGDEALIDYSKRFDRIDLAATGIAVSREEVAAAEANCSSEQLAALDLALERITAFHERQKPQDLRFRDAAGVELGWRWTPARFRGALCAGRHGGLSVLRADECRAGEGRGREAHRHGRPDARRPCRTAGARRRQALRHR